MSVSPSRMNSVRKVWFFIANLCSLERYKTKKSVMRTEKEISDENGKRTQEH